MKINFIYKSAKTTTKNIQKSFNKLISDVISGVVESIKRLQYFYSFWKLYFYRSQSNFCKCESIWCFREQNICYSYFFQSFHGTKFDSGNFFGVTNKAKKTKSFLYCWRANHKTFKCFSVVLVVQNNIAQKRYKKA